MNVPVFRAASLVGMGLQPALSKANLRRWLKDPGPRAGGNGDDRTGQSAARALSLPWPPESNCQPRLK